MKYLKYTSVMYLPMKDGEDADTVAHDHLVDDFPKWMESRGIKWRGWVGSDDYYPSEVVELDDSIFKWPTE